MKRRDFLKNIGAASFAVLAPRLTFAAEGADYSKLLILVELKGGNDGLNTVIPYSAREYYDLRPRLGIPRDQIVQLTSTTGLHPSLQPLTSLWESREVAVVQGVGYPNANLSHFRSIEIWDTASRSDEYLNEGWLARTFAATPAPKSFAADGVVVGSAEMGPLAGARMRAIALANTEQFLRQARLATPSAEARSGALNHIMKVESDIVQAAGSMHTDYNFRTDFPKTPFGNAVHTAAQVIASKAHVAAMKITLNGFDTHSGQQATQARLLKELAEGLIALKSALVETARWDSTLVLTYAEFGRRPRENQSGGTDHGTANVHLMTGGRVRGGLYGEAPALSRLDGNGNLAHVVDFRQLYATILERWWSISSTGPLRGRFAPLDVIRA